MIPTFDPGYSVLLQPTEQFRKVTDQSAFGQSAIRLEALNEHHPMVIQGLAAWRGSVSDECDSVKWG
jgi:FPC/CPF motif-containing protein YcgG